MEEHLNKLTIDKEIVAETPIIIAISGPSGAGKDYLISKAKESFTEEKTNVIVVQMTTDREHRGEVETKICVTPDEYTNLQDKGLLVGDHVNKKRYGYNISDIQSAIKQAGSNGLVLLELNPTHQKQFSEQLLDKTGASLSAWIGVSTTTEQTIQNMRERGETEETIAARIAIIEEFVNSMKENPMITMCDNGPNNRANSANDFINIIRGYKKD